MAGVIVNGKDDFPVKSELFIILSVLYLQPNLTPPTLTHETLSL